MFNLLERWALNIIARKLRNNYSYSLDVLQELWPAEIRPIYTVDDMAMHGRRIRDDEKVTQLAISSRAVKAACQNERMKAQKEVEQFITLAYIAGRMSRKNES